MEVDRLLPSDGPIGVTPRRNGEQHQSGRTRDKRKTRDIRDVPSSGKSSEEEERKEKKPRQSPIHNNVQKMKKALTN